MPLSRPLTLAVSAVLVLVTAGCGGAEDDPTVAAPSTTASSTGAPAAGSTEKAALKIAGFEYLPKTLTVAPGTSIEVTNEDGAEHTVTSEAKGKFDAAEIKQNDPVTFKAPGEAGTYKYICTYHPNMRGTLVVA